MQEENLGLAQGNVELARENEEIEEGDLGLNGIDVANAGEKNPEEKNPFDDLLSVLGKLRI